MAERREQLLLFAENAGIYDSDGSSHERMMDLQIYSKDSLIQRLLEIRDQGWIPNARPGNAGGVGHTLEDLLGIKENNLPIPNDGEWELKSQRATTTAPMTLFHLEPSPQALKFVPHTLVPRYGWRHQEAGLKYPITEMSFRQTISALARSDRGFAVIVDRPCRKVLISFDASTVDARHSAWLEQVQKRVGLGDLVPQPYWGFDDLLHKAATKLQNSFYVVADVRRREGIEFFHYSKIWMLRNFSLEGLLTGLEEGRAFVDFDARTGHNHGTKFRLRPQFLPRLYSDIKEIA